MPAADVSQGTSATPEDLHSPVPAKARYATKTALSLTLAYLIPMAMGWPQAQTAAITVMLIAATGMVSDSLQKGVMRVLGTVAGALIGLCLIALFPQDRMAYLLAASVIVAATAYLYNAYQGDSTVFMLTSVVTLMMFNGGDAEGAFLYGINRAYMTAFGVIVYTVVASTLWPVRAADNTRGLAAQVARGYGQAFTSLVKRSEPEATDKDRQLADLLKSEYAFQSQFAANRHSAEGVATYLAEWNTVVGCYEELEAILVPALQRDSGEEVAYERFLDNYPQLLEQVETLFGQVDASWRGEPADSQLRLLPVQYRDQSLRQEKHLTVAAVATRAELLRNIQQVLLELQSALDSMLFDRGHFVARREPAGKPVFIWRDLENTKTAVRSFITFWIATAIWITLNPPGGFLFVTLCTVLVPLVSYTPVTPRLLFILLSLGFMFALPAYVFLLPQLTHWLELAAFMFGYAFIGFYVFQGPVSIFFLLGLMTLGIQNTMSYQFDAILLLVLTFYLLCALLMITTHFPFTSKPERIYPNLCRRFFRSCARSVRHNTSPPELDRLLSGLRADGAAGLLAKMHNWGAKIDEKFFTANPQSHIGRLNRACDLLQGQLQALARRRREFAQNRLIAAARRRWGPSLLAQLCDILADNGGRNEDNEPFSRVGSRLTGIQEQLDELRRNNDLEKYELRELAQFYVYLNLQASILASLRACREAQQALDWQQLGETRF